MFIVGIDVGGTFTDLAAVDESTGRVVVTKLPSRPRNEAAAVLAGLGALGMASRDVRRLVHGTTVGTNAVLERRGARVAVLTTAGFRDLIEIGRTKRNIPVLFVPTFVRPKPMIERKHRFEVVERLDADGSVLVPLDLASVERALDGALAAGAEALAVCLLHSYVNPAHERAVAEAAKGRRPGLPVSCSAEVVAEYREFERFSTTVLNAYLQPLMDEYLTGIEEGLRATGYAHGVLTVGSSGGMMTTETARRLPIKTIFSGPAGGVSQACFVGAATGLRDVITYDIEAVEQLYPVRVERTALREDSGGPGRWRRGLGLTREVRIRATGSQLSVLAEKAVLPPFGVCGGAAGAPNRFWVRRNDRSIEPSPLPGKVSGFPLDPDDVLVMESSGGGFGDPLDRDLSRIGADLAEGYVTAPGAEAIYGVVVTGGAIDTAATLARRAALRAARPRVRVTAGRGLETERSRALRLDAETAGELGVAAGAVVELVNPRGAPLRAWVAGIMPGNGRRAEVAAVALRMLALADGAEVEVRAVHSGLLGAARASGGES